MTFILNGSGQDQKKVVILFSKTTIGFYQVDVGFKTTTDPTFIGSKIVTIGDLNNDKLNDVVTLSED